MVEVSVRGREQYGSQAALLDERLQHAVLAGGEVAGVDYDALFGGVPQYICILLQRIEYESGDVHHC